MKTRNVKKRKNSSKVSQPHELDCTGWKKVTKDDFTDDFTIYLNRQDLAKIFLYPKAEVIPNHRAQSLRSGLRSLMDRRETKISPS